MVLGNLIIYQNGAIREFEKPEVCEAINVANANRWTVYLTPIEWDDREARLKKEHEKHANASDKMGMTLKEAKDILKKEFAVIGIHKSTEPFEFDESRWIEHEKPSVLEAFRVLSKEGYYVTISGHDYNMRENRLKKEYEENTNAPGSAENHIKEDSSENPALKESATQFNDALLDEQVKKIKRLGKEIARLNKIIHKKNEELRLTKIREKNLAELGLKYVVENEKLKKELADKVVDKIDAQALKSAESALAWKEKVVTYKDMALAYNEKKIAEKDEEIADLGNELEATKKELEAFKESYKRRIKEDSEHFEHIQKICNAGLQKWLIESEYLEKDKPFRFPQLPDFSEEEKKKVSSAKDTHPTEDNPEEIAIEKAVKLVRKAMKEGHTVTIQYEN